MISLIIMKSFRQASDIMQRHVSIRSVPSCIPQNVFGLGHLREGYLCSLKQQLNW